MADGGGEGREAQPTPLDDFRATTNLGRRSLRGGVVTLAGQIAKLLLHLAALVVMARLLRPADFGLVAMVLPLLGLASLFQDFGLSAATVQKRTITHAQSSTLFWINVGLSLLLAAGVAACSPLVAWFYGDARLVPLVLVIAGLVVCSGLTAQHLALLRRRMNFTRLVKQDVSSLGLGLAAGLVAALSGMGYWALLISMAARALSLLCMVWLAAEWQPGLPARGAGVRPMIRFGRNLTASDFCDFLIRNVDSILIGKVWGVTALGFYDRAYSFLRLYLQVNVPINSVAVPTLSRLQDDPARYRRFFLRGLGLITGISMPFVVFLAVGAHNLVRLALGPKWMEVVPLFWGLFPAAFVATFNAATRWIYASLGRTNRQLRWTLFVQLPASLAAYSVGLPFGPLGVAIAFSCVTVLLRFPAINYCLDGLPITLRDVIGALLPAAWSSLAAAAVLILIRSYFVPTLAGTAVIAVAFDLLVYGLCYLLFYLVPRAGRKNITSYWRILGNLRPRSLPVLTD